MKEKINAEKMGKLLLYMSVTLELIIVIIDKSNYTNPIEGQLFRLTFLLAAGKVILTKYKPKEWMIMILFCAVGFISYRLTGRNEMLRIVVFIAALKGTDVRKLLKYVFYFTLAGCMLLVFFSVTGIYGGLYREENFGRGMVEIRYCLGLGHPNALHCMFMMLVLLELYLYNEKMKWYSYVVLILLNYGLYVLTDSNTGMLMTFCGIAGAVLFRYVQILKEMKWPYMAGIALFLLCVGLSVLLAWPAFTQPQNFGFANPVAAGLESKLNGRIVDLYYGSENAEGTIATWSLFSVPDNSYYFDMGFVRLFYWYGVIPGLLYVLMNVLLLWQFGKNKDAMGLVLISVLAVYTVVEAHIISVYIGRNYIFILIGLYMSGIIGTVGKGKERFLWNSWRRLNEAEE